MDSTSSVSKGVFVFAKKCRAAHSKVHMKSEQRAQWRADFEEAWDSLEQQMQTLYTQMFSKLLNNIITFLQRETPDIPTVTLLSGINIPDHGQLFSALERQLHADVSPHVIKLSSRSCTRVRSLLASILNQCRPNTQEENDDEEETTEVRSYRSAQCTYDMLVQWYTNQYPCDIQRPPLVIILTDFESFAPQVLQDFIYIASEHRADVPVALVFGVATTENAVHSSLPHRAMSRLDMATFVSQNSNSLLHQLISKVILSPQCSFKVGAKVFRMLTDNFLFYDFSVHSFLQKFKLCMLEYYSSDVAEIAAHVKSNEWSNLDTKAISRVQSLRSSMNFIEACSQAEIARLLQDNQHFKTVLADQVTRFERHFFVFLVGLQCLHELAACMPGAPLGKHLGDMYFRAVGSRVWETKDFTECRQLWGHVAKSQLESHLKNLIHILKSGDKLSGLREWSVKLRAARKKLQALDEEDPSPSNSPRFNCLSVLDNRSQFTENLRQNARCTPALNKFERLREEILVMLEEMLTMKQGRHLCLLYPPGLLPYHELLLFDDLASIRDQLIGNSRAALCAALSDPSLYLQCKCCILNESDDVLPSMPDVCVAYKVHLESGKHINLYDWLQAFHCIVSNNQYNVNVHTQARFTQAVAELQFLGFVKPTFRKADHVMRLTWGTM